MRFEIRRLAPRHAERQRGRDPVSTKPTCGGECLDQAISAPGHAGSHAWDDERHPLDQRNLI